MMNYIFMILALLKKEIICIWFDKSTRALLIVPPIIQAILFGYVATFDLKDVTFIYNDNCRSAETIAIKSKLVGNPLFKEVVIKDDNDNPIDYINSGEALIVINIGSDFSKNLQNNVPASVLVYADGRTPVSASLSVAYVKSIFEGYFKEEGNVKNANATKGLSINVHNLYNENSYTRWMIIPGLIATVNLIQVIMLAALSVTREKEKGTFEQLMVTPFTPTQILIGKALPPVIVGLVQSTFVLVISLFLFQIPFKGNFIHLYIGLFLFTTSCVGIGLTISALCKNMQQGMLYAFLILVPMVLLSGLMSPLENTPEMWQYATYVNPLRYAIDLCKRIYLEGISISALFYDILPLILITMITMPFAAKMFRKNLIS